MDKSKEVYSEESLEENIDITFDDVVNFWMTLFPEVKSVEDFKKLLQNSSKTELSNLEKAYYKNSNADNTYKLFDNAFNRESNLEFMFDKIQKQYQWTYFFRPVIEYYSEDLYEFIQKSLIIEDKEELFFGILSTTVKNLYELAFKVLILETNVARMENRLVGDTPKQKAGYFIKVLLRDKDYLMNLYSEYSELTRLMDLTVRNTFSYVKEIIESTGNEMKSLEENFGQGKVIGKIANISLGEGDTHNRGKTVGVITFSSGIKLIYKPRLLDLENRFCEFVDWINKQKIPGFKELKACKLHTVNGAGWMECIENIECSTEEQVKNFYIRTGQLLNILYMFNAKDFHYENLIAQGEYPILIDLETLLHPDMFNGNVEELSADAKAMKLISNSVKGIALLPTQIINNKTDKVLEVGGLCGESNQEAPFKSIFIKDHDTDEICVEEGYGIIEAKMNNPIINGSKVASDLFIKEIKEGFENLYRWILRNKKVYADKIKELFEDCICRVIFRPTNVYCQLLSTSYHPDLLRNQTDRDVYLHRIGVIGTGKEIIESELNDMFIGDVPYFSTYVNRNIVLNSRKEEIEFRYKKTTLDSILEKIEIVTEEDLDRQMALIDISFIDKSENKGRIFTKVNFQEEKVNLKLNKLQLLNTANLIGDYIIEKSIVGGKDGVIDRTWIGSIEIGEKASFITPVGMDLYAGNSGIALFLAYLGSTTGEEKYKKAAIEAIEPIIRYLDELKDITNEKIGAFSGISGWLYSIFHIGHTLKNQKLLDYVQKGISIMKELTGKTQCHDIISGYAGALGVMLSIYEKTENKELKMELISLCNTIFKELKDSIVVLKNQKGITWGEEGYVGYSHGNAGIEAQLMRLYSITKEDSILQIVKDSLSYERSMFDEKSNNWKKQLTKDEISYAWCHGAPGILLSRLMMVEAGYDDEKIRKEISIAMETTKRECFGMDYCLCHGDIGNLRILHYAANVLNDSTLKLQCETTLDVFINEYFIESFKQGNFKQTENVSLMLGPTGIGYGLLQFYKPDIMPEILRLG
ncbi:nisin biosynthesis protein NisC [Clostridium saccharobutylicum]|uniref:type 2 lanthipeptide synthetase LanM family protein n=1 Tax=Clostridium saccharobutylicum TaxID=169679 RepID=UPI000983984D|nr:type 2 lanthipeptide synthetase LanM family protein [Clostridium saccharobutylicum]AQS12171.1 nisin biosynthesis protein NisC [Clostridium saccharobutylicum]MBC2437378.1 type 2 lantipeptide synthetase LanM [Clostridium saccharobutylicum]NSB89632.1 type 2 lantibiotic biosynthesis protein LanM [Clostridium saccharobutylicum]NYC29808.1 type 2 lantibiotic biosynthesis protein LanM [Clostridium saccharobutylicum]OOM18158.1 nisin biosynthesis protein NisC [Clostridium saccharobutylicum]